MLGRREALTCASGLALCAAALILSGRPQQRGIAGASVTSKAERGPGHPAPPGAPGPPPLTPPPDGARTAETAPFVATPLFEARARLEVGKETLLRFRAHDQRAGAPAVHEDLGVAVVHLPERRETRLPVREVEPGVYAAEFTPAGPGQYLVAVSSGGLPVRTPAPVSLGVVGAVGGGSELQEQEAEALTRHRRSRSRPGGGWRAPRGG